MLPSNLASKVAAYVNTFSCFYCKQLPKNDALVTKCGHICCKICLLQTFQSVTSKSNRVRCCGKSNTLRFEDYFDEEERHDEAQFAYLNCLITAARNLQRAFLAPQPPLTPQPPPAPQKPIVQAPVVPEVHKPQVQTPQVTEVSQPSTYTSSVNAEQTPKSRVRCGLQRSGSVKRTPIADTSEPKDALANNNHAVVPAVTTVDESDAQSRTRKSVDVPLKTAIVVLEKAKSPREMQAVVAKEKTSEKRTNQPAAGAPEEAQSANLQSADNDPYAFSSQQSQASAANSEKVMSKKGRKVESSSAAAASASTRKRGRKAPALPTVATTGKKTRRTANEVIAEAEVEDEDYVPEASHNKSQSGNVRRSKSVQFSNNTEVHEFGNTQSQATSEVRDGGHAPVISGDPHSIGSSTDDVTATAAFVSTTGSSLSGHAEWTHTFDSETDSMRFVVIPDDKRQPNATNENLDTASPKRPRKNVGDLELLRDERQSVAESRSSSVSKASKRKVSNANESVDLVCLSHSEPAARSSASHNSMHTRTRFAKAPLDEPTSKDPDFHNSASSTSIKSISPPTNDRTTSLNDPVSCTPSLNTAVVVDDSGASLRTLHVNSMDRRSGEPHAKSRLADGATRTAAPVYCDIALSPIRAEANKKDDARSTERCDIGLSPIRFDVELLHSPPPKRFTSACQTSPSLLSAYVKKSLKQGLLTSASQVVSSSSVLTLSVGVPQTQSDCNVDALGNHSDLSSEIPMMIHDENAVIGGVKTAAAVPQSPSRYAVSNVDELSRDGPASNVSDSDSESFILSQTPTGAHLDERENLPMQISQSDRPLSRVADGTTNMIARFNEHAQRFDFIEMAADSNSNSEFHTATSNPNSQFPVRSVRTCISQPALERVDITNAQGRSPLHDVNITEQDASDTYVDAVTSRYDSATLNESEAFKSQKPLADVDADDELISMDSRSSVSVPRAHALPQAAVIARLSNVMPAANSNLRESALSQQQAAKSGTTKDTVEPIEIEDEQDSDLETLARELPNVQRDLAAVRRDLLFGAASASQLKATSSSQGALRTATGENGQSRSIKSTVSDSGIKRKALDAAAEPEAPTCSGLETSKNTVAERRKVLIVSSTLNAEEKSWLTQFRERFIADVDIEVNAQFLVDHTTHVVMGTPLFDDDDASRLERLADLVLGVEVNSILHRVCMRTIKFLLGIAAGCWVVNANWLRTSLERGVIADEHEFEVICDVELLHESASNDSTYNSSMSLDESRFADTLSDRIEAPQRAREHRTKSKTALFKSTPFARTVFTFTSANTCTAEELATLIEHAGLRYISFDRLIALVREQNAVGMQLLHTLDCDNIIGMIDAAGGRQSAPNNSQLERNRQMAKFRQLKVPQDAVRLINVEWLIDSIATFSHSLSQDSYSEMID